MPVARREADLVEADVPAPLLPAGVGAGAAHASCARSRRRSSTSRRARSGASSRRSEKRRGCSVMPLTRGAHQVDVRRRDRIRVVGGVPGCVGDDHLAVDDGVELALELVDAGLAERQLERVADAVVGFGLVRVGVERQVVDRDAGDRVHRVGADPVPGDALSEVDVHDRVRPLVVTERHLGVGGACDRRRGAPGGRRAAARSQRSGVTTYHPFIPMCRWENTWQW